MTISFYSIPFFEGIVTFHFFYDHSIPFFGGTATFQQVNKVPFTVTFTKWRQLIRFSTQKQ